MGELRYSYANNPYRTDYQPCHICGRVLGKRCQGCKRYICEDHGDHLGGGAYCTQCHYDDLKREDSIGRLA